MKTHVKTSPGLGGVRQTAVLDRRRQGQNDKLPTAQAHGLAGPRLAAPSGGIQARLKGGPGSTLTQAYCTSPQWMQIPLGRSADRQVSDFRALASNLLVSPHSGRTVELDRSTQEYRCDGRAGFPRIARLSPGYALKTPDAMSRYGSRRVDGDISSCHASGTRMPRLSAFSPVMPDDRDIRLHALPDTNKEQVFTPASERRETPARGRRIALSHGALQQGQPGAFLDALAVERSSSWALVLQGFCCCWRRN